ncbi:hypothetical protein PDESU_05878 [Pontiella desulfatans]|uniref:Uncharacterized protein n=1 Tax=Pontiella desulfatans TaxID=2750659 RepID=A0A6C2UAW2_PONDE|nr:hypothetical protein [Pontiella desulfatans]VGO17282.1 hypothetical protein PDESU_05878 [Pontiella desulfatans]
MNLRRIIAFASVGLAWSAGAQGSNLSPVVIWEAEGSVSAAVGHRDNVLRSSIATESSAFFQSSVDASLIRYSDSGSLFMFYIFGEDTRYVDAPSVDYEQFISATVQLIEPVGDRNETGLEANYLYQHQILDASVTEVDVNRVLVLGHSAYLRPYWMHRMGKWEAQVEASVLRQVFEHTLDDYWEAEAEARLTRNYGNRSEVSVGYVPMWRLYDTREQYDSGGSSVPGTELTYLQNEVDGEWRHYWDQDRHWRTTSRVSFMASRDNGSGYFDYDRLYFREQVWWSKGNWEIKAAARFGWYYYREQLIDNEHRYRSYATLDYSITRWLGDHWKLFTAGEHEWNMSNDPFDEYRSWMVNCGAGYEF